jgi:hypothetical protein
MCCWFFLLCLCVCCPLLTLLALLGFAALLPETRDVGDTGMPATHGSAISLPHGRRSSPLSPTSRPLGSYGSEGRWGWEPSLLHSCPLASIPAMEVVMRGRIVRVVGWAVYLYVAYWIFSVIIAVNRW